MTKYRVQLFQKVIEETWVEVEADNEGAAGDMAIEAAGRGECQWQFYEATDDAYEVVEVEVKKVVVPDYLRPLLDKEDES